MDWLTGCLDPASIAWGCNSITWKGGFLVSLRSSYDIQRSHSG